MPSRNMFIISVLNVTAHPLRPGVPVAILQRYDTANVFTITDLFGGPGIGLESRSVARVCVFACVN